jgi:hypothetical protein
MTLKGSTNSDIGGPPQGPHLLDLAPGFRGLKPTATHRMPLRGIPENAREASQTKPIPRPPPSNWTITVHLGLSNEES